ncbi:response regulator [Qipengyuania sp. XHP0207]|uniref:response regulator n=1 Tax=Qipengyuania sp. XHP0207 TaxID=3038078 RepID=UPI00241D4490|nr:response regulator [Qipengyuania sp. XHP0207]MDG5746599.1 response regulator [Qipengyuania sp. XHP0207]
MSDNVHHFTSLGALIVEDEPFIAMDLEHGLEEVGFKTSVYASCEDAHRVVRQTVFEAAVLDVNLSREETSIPIAERLIELRIPFVFHTGDVEGNAELLARFNAPIIPKPMPSSVVAHTLKCLVEGVPTDEFFEAIQSDRNLS